MSVKLPNFLIAGAAKSGTTSLYLYLNQHPEVYMSPVKEPKFITAQFIKFPLRGIGDSRTEKGIIKTFDEYKTLFSKVKDEKAIGEASIDSLYFYEGAIPIIKKYLGDIKIIIILRNPIDRAFSQYVMFTDRLRESLSFEDALKAEEERVRNNWAFGWHYTRVGFYYNQVRSYLQNFTHVKVYLYDDLRQDTAGVVKDLYEFLGVDSSFVPDTHVKYNISGVPRNKIYHNLLTRPGRLKSTIKKICTLLLLQESLYKLVNKLRSGNLEKIEMKPETRNYLKDVYREDILKLQALIRRDLSHWLK